MNYKFSLPVALLVAGSLFCAGCQGNAGAGASSPADSGGSPSASTSGAAPAPGAAPAILDDSKFRIVKLKGLSKPVKLIELTDLHFGKPSDPPALLFRYRTDLPVSPVTPASRGALHAEALQLWTDVQKMAEVDHLQLAVITACDAPPKGGKQSAHTVNFAWALRNGAWQEIA